MDELAHWHVCEHCQEELDKAPHQFTWTLTQPAALGMPGIEEGVCSVCGYKTTRQIPALEPENVQPEGGGGFDGTLGLSENSFRTIVLGVFGAMGVGVATLLITGVIKRARRRR